MEDKIYYNSIGKIRNIVREIYQLPNGKIYLKIDTSHGIQLHIELDDVGLDKLNDECLIMKVNKKED